MVTIYKYIKDSYLLLAKVCSNTNNLRINKRFFQKITLRLLFR